MYMTEKENTIILQCGAEDNHVVLGLVLLVAFNLKMKNKIAPGNVLMSARGGNKNADRIIENSTQKIESQGGKQAGRKRQKSLSLAPVLKAEQFGENFPCCSLPVILPLCTSKKGLAPFPP